MAETPPIDINTLYQTLLAFTDDVASRISAIDTKLAGLAAIASKAADSAATREAILLLEKNIDSLRSGQSSLRQQMELYMNRDQLLKHTHDGMNSERISYRHLKDRELESQLASKAPVERGYDLSGIGMTGTAVTFDESYEAMPYVVPTILKSSIPNANLVVRSELSATPMGFILRSFTKDGVEVSGVPFSYLVWKPSN